MEATKNIINKKLQLFADVFMNDNTNMGTDTLALLVGKGGNALFLAEYYLHNGDEQYRNRVIAYLDEILSFLDEAELETIHPTHCAGLAGFGWLLNYLKDRKVIGDEYDECLPEIEALLEAILPVYLETDNFDLLHGAMGMGLFLLTRNNVASVESIIHELDRIAIKTEKEIKWTRYDQYREIALIYDMGLAHGNPGVLYFLSKCYEANVLPKLCKTLMLGNINFHLNNIQDISKVKSFFTNCIKVEEYSKSENQPRSTRLAWCYGDLGVLNTLYLAASLLKEDQLAEKFLKMLETTTKRRSYEESTIEDAGFCHGSSGSGYMYLRLYQVTKNKLFKDAYKFWLNNALSGSNHNMPDALGGYIFKKNITEWGECSKLLTGLSGVGMFFLASLDDKKLNKWDNCFFLS